MAFFGFGWKRDPRAQAVATRQAEATASASSSAAAGKTGARKTDPRAAPQPARPVSPKPAAQGDRAAGVEVSELTLDDHDFSSTFGPSSQFADAAHAPGVVVDDPWSSMLRRD